MSKHEPLSLRERQMIAEYLTTKLSISHISQLMHRGKNTIVAEIRKNGGRHVYDAEKAHERITQINYERYANLSNKQKGKRLGYVALKDRVEALEMQIEILFDTIKGMVNDSENT